jgi:ATP-dependent DNA helicase RecG
MNFTISLTGATSLVVSGIYRIANVFYKAGFVESWGKGTNNIIETCLKMGLPTPSYDYSFHAVNLTFYKTTQETTVAKVIALIKANPRITRLELAQKLNKSDATIKEHLDKLKRSGKLIRVGSTKSGEWKIVREDAGNE